MSTAALLSQILGDEAHDPDEETFVLFSNLVQPAKGGLGFCDGAASALDLTVAGQEFTIKQSPTILKSNRELGTTGAVVWQVTPTFAEWLTSPSNFLFDHGIVHADSTVLELGCGVSGIIPLILGSRVKRYVATDQAYVLKLLRQNIEGNRSAVKLARRRRPLRTAVKDKRAASSSECKEGGAGFSASNIQLLELDWEESSLNQLPQILGGDARIDLIVVCDCIFNEALVDPLVETCVSISRVRTGAAAAAAAASPSPSLSSSSSSSTTKSGDQTTVCIFAQQLRAPEVFERWLATMLKYFRVWRVPQARLTPALYSSAGYTVHVAILK